MRSPNSLLRAANSSVRCCNSPSSRAFSIAITAWSAKVRDQFDLPLGERLDPLPREINRADHGSPSRSSGTPSMVRRPARRSLGRRVVRVGEDVRDMHDLAFERHPPGDAVATGDN